MEKEKPTKLRGLELVNAVNRAIPSGTTFIHFDNEKVYFFFRASLHTETGEVIINYEDYRGEFFSRPYTSFFSKELMSDGQWKEKFINLDIKNRNVVKEWIDVLSKDIIW
jgi:hypothetical protein